MTGKQNEILKIIASTSEEQQRKNPTMNIKNYFLLKGRQYQFISM